MLTSIRHFSLPKAGNSQEEYEDAHSFNADNDREHLYAIADGATETSFSGLWAQILTSAFVNDRLAQITENELKPLSSEWNQQVLALIGERNLPWYVEEKVIQGAFSSILGLRIRSDKTWHAICTGDSCLFHIRRGKLIRAFPIQQPEGFTYRPALISTRIARNKECEPTVLEGRWESGDYFFLMTDALAQYFLMHKQDSPVSLVKFLCHIKRTLDFEEFIREARLTDLHNDDVTFLRIHIDKAENSRELA